MMRLLLDDGTRSLRRSLACAALLSLAACADEPAIPEDAIEITEIVRDLLVDPPEWEVERAHPKQDLLAVEVITPALHHRFDGSDMISLVLAPPADVSFVVADADGPTILRARAGVDITAFQYLSEAAPESTFSFEVLVNDELRFQGDVTIARDRRRRAEEVWKLRPRRNGSSWLDVGGEDGLAVEPGDRVTFRTHASAAGIPDSAIVMGFGGLRLERRRYVARTPSSVADPNLVLVVMDTLRTDRLGVYGYERDTSPVLDRMAERGALFENAYATASWTLPSTASILTGLHPEEHGVTDQGNYFLAWQLSTLAEALQRRGFSTAAWSGNPLISKSRNFSQGFEHFGDDLADFRKTGAFFDEVDAWLAERADDRFFLFLQLTEPHEPYDPLASARAKFALEIDEAFDADAVEKRLLQGDRQRDYFARLERLVSEEERRTVDALYDACVWSGDHWLGRLEGSLARLGLDDRTVIVFTSDHGEELFDRGFLGHARSLMGELVRAPLVVAGPGVPAGARIDASISNRLVGPYLAYRGGATLGSEAGVDPLFGERASEPVLFSTEKGDWNGQRGVRIRGMRDGPFVVHFAPTAIEWGGTSPLPDGEVRIYDLGADPGETRDLGDSRPDDARRLREEIARRFGALKPAVEGTDLSVGAGTRNLLDRIGYTGE